VNGLAFIGLGAGIVPLGLLILLIVAVTGGRNEADPDAERPAALYYAAVFFVTLFTTLFAVFAVGASLLDATTHDDTYSSSQFGFVERGTETVTVNGETILQPVPAPSQTRLGASRAGEHDDEYATALRGLLIGAIAVAVYSFHERRRRDQRVGPVGDRVRRTYLYTVSFTAVLIAVVAGGVAL
jgi:hypothetical protein